MTRLTRWLLAGLAAAALSGCEGSDLTQPVAGSIRVTASTSGDSLDTDGYTVVLDGDSVQALGSGASVTLEEVGAGDHDLKLTRVAPNCAVSGSNPRRVTVAPAATVELTFEVECSASGTVAISSATTGFAPDLDGYRVEVDERAGWPIGSSASIVVPGLSVAVHTLRLVDIAQNCTVVGRNPLPVTIPAGGTVAARFDVVCVRSPSSSAGQLLFTSNRSGRLQIYRMNEDGSAIVDLTPDAQAGGGRWSPDGSKIVFTSVRDGNSEIYLMDADGSHQTRLTRTPEHEIDPAWSPDGTRIAYAAGDKVWIMNADGSGVTAVTDGAEPSWSPDGTRIAFSRQSTRYDPLAEVYTMDICTVVLDGSAFKILTNTAIVFQSFATPAWSPDGTRIAVWQHAPGPTFPSYTSNLTIVRADGSGQAMLTGPTVYRTAPVWSPDGMAIAFATREPGGVPGIRVFAMPGGAIHTLAPSPASQMPTSWR